MVAFASLPVFFALSALVIVGIYLAHSRLNVGSAILTALGAGILGLYLVVAIAIDLIEIF